MHRVSLGIDTSNYKTSVSMVCEDGSIICNLQRFLEIKKGERGLRQSVALFQHINNLPQMLEEAFAILRRKDSDAVLEGVSVSERPRPVEGSYMPCFLAGISQAKGIAAALDIPYFGFSHQEGHIEAVRHGTKAENWDRFLSFHFSGGTTEGLLAEEKGNSLSVDIVGGSRDLAFGQVLDRVGVALGMEFPCGAEMDRLAGDGRDKVKNNLLPKIKCKDGYINLSGIETKCQRAIAELPKEELILMLFARMGQAVEELILQLSDSCETNRVLLAGGVSASSYLRAYLEKKLQGYELCLGDAALSGDNAVGIAFLGGKNLWR